MDNKVTVRVRACEGRDYGSDQTKTEVIMESHWSSSDFVVLTIGTQTVCVPAMDLHKAITSAT